MRFGLLGVGLAVVVAGLPVSPAHAGGIGCGSVITEDTVLDRDLECSGNGLVIGADGVDLKLGGHTISGEAGRGVGISNPGFADVTIFDGDITGFRHGVHLSERSRGNTLGELNVSGAGDYGILLTDSHRNFIDGNHVDGNGSASSGGAGIALVRSHRNHLEENEAHNNADGVLLDRSNDNTVQETNAGFVGSDGNARTGIVLLASKGNEVVSNVAAENERAGIYLDRRSTGNTVAGNLAEHNNGLGINAEQRGNDGGDNQARNNLGPAQCRNIVCR